MIAAFLSSFNQIILLLAVFFYLFAETAQLLNQMLLVPLKHRKALGALKNKFSLLRIYFTNDKLSFFLILGVDYLVVPISIIFGLVVINQNSSNLLPVWIVYVGLFMLCIGEVIRLWATYVLGKFFTGMVIVTSDHKLIMRGPYKFVRHPGYLGGLIIILGSGLMTREWFIPIITFVLFCIAYAYRIYIEESALKKKFGKDYIEYSKRTPMIIPYLF
jgi:protein-S-isoprenylcysteine O-methyltransferase Ste14